MRQTNLRETLAKLATLAGVAHDIAHHAQSGLSWLYPHLGDACREAGVLAADADLLVDKPYPAGLPERRPLRLALGALRKTFAAILTKHGFDLADIESARLECVFPAGYGDGSLYQVRCILGSRGRRFERSLKIIGESHAYVPDLPGCVAAGETREEALTHIRDAIEFHLDGLKKAGRPIPRPSSTGETVDVHAA